MSSNLKFLVLFLIFPFCSFAQNDSVIAIPGTHCSLIPPRGFVIADRFTGFFENLTGSSIMINEIPESYQKMIPQLTPEAFLTQRMIIASTEKILFKNQEATLFTATQTANGLEYKKILLVFGVEGKTILVNGIYPLSAKHLEEPIQKALLTVQYNQGKANQSEAIFSISTEGTNFSKISSTGSSIVYSTDSVQPAPPSTPVFIVTVSVDRIAKENRKSYAESRVLKLPRGDQNKIIATEPVTIDGLQGYEVIANGISKTGQPEKIYEVILYNIEGDYYIMIGSASEDIKNNLETFKKLASTFELRKS